MGSITKAGLERENLAFSGTPGTSDGNRDHGFIPAFRDTETGQVLISCFSNGIPAPMHTIEGLPDSWIIERDSSSGETAVKSSVVTGFVRDGCFYTRSQAVEAVLTETSDRQ